MSSEAITAARIDLVEFLLGALDEPTEPFVSALIDERAALPDVDINRPLNEGFTLLEAFVTEHRDRPVADVHADLVGEHARLFGGTDPVVAAREREYRPTATDGATPDETTADVTASLESTYAAAGWEPPADATPDALTTELAFLRALLAGQRDGIEAAAGHERAFIDDHLAEWVGVFATDLGESASLRFYGATAAIAAGVVDFESAFVDTLLEE